MTVNDILTQAPHATECADLRAERHALQVQLGLAQRHVRTLQCLTGALLAGVLLGAFLQAVLE
jgi:hypothetical protein